MARISRLSTSRSSTPRVSVAPPTMHASTSHAGAGASEVDACIVGGATLTLGVDDLEVDKRDILAIGLQAAWSQNRSQLDGYRWACRIQHLLGDDLVSILADSLDAAGGELNVRESEDPAGVGLGVDAGGLAVDEELDRLGVGDDVDGLRGLRPVGLGGRVGPVAEDVQVGLLVLDDSVGKVEFLGDRKSVHLAADEIGRA